LRRNRAQMTPDYRSIRNKVNRYEQDRSSMRSEGYSGMALIFQVHDLCVTEGMGPIIDRTKEHLTPMDRAIIAARKLLLKSIADLQEGREPANVVRSTGQNPIRLVACEDLVPESKPWKEYIREKLYAQDSIGEAMP